jgi:hypothetical protein
MTSPFWRTRTFRFLSQAFWLVGAIAWTAIVLDLALQPAGKTGWLVKMLGGDKIVHGLAFTVGEVVWVKSIETIARLGRWGATAIGTVIALSVGAAIELLQRNVPTRSSDYRDFLADLAGVLLAMGLLSIFAARHSARSSARIDSHGITK